MKSCTMRGFAEDDIMKSDANTISCLLDDTSESHVVTSICMIHTIFIWYKILQVSPAAADALGPLLLTWINFNPSMDKLSHIQWSVGEIIIYPVPNFNGTTVEVWNG